MAGAGLAIPQDAFTIASNPAGLTRLKTDEFSFGLNYFNPSRSYTAGMTEGTGGMMPGRVISDRPDFVCPEMAGSWRQSETSVVGFAVTANGGMNTSWPGSANGGYGTFGDGPAGVNLEQIFLSGTYAKELADGASVGASLIFVNQCFEARGLSNFAGFVQHGPPYNLTDNGRNNSQGIGFRVSAMEEIDEGLTAAVAFQPQIKMSRFNRYSDLFAEQGRFDIPSTVQAGVALELDEDSHLAVDFRHIGYSGVPAVGNPFSNLGNGLGADDGPGFGWRDMNVYKIGYQNRVDDEWTVRCGVSYGRQPIPSSEILFNILAPGVQEWHYALGATKRMGDDRELSFSLVYSPESSVTGINPMQTDQTLTVEMKQFELGLQYTRHF